MLHIYNLKQVYQELLSYASDEDYGDFTDVVQGFDMTVDVVQGNPYPTTSIRVKPRQTPLSDNNEEVEKWLKEQPELLKYYKKYSYDEMKEALQNWLNPDEEGSTQKDSDSDSSGYTLNVKQKPAEFNEDEFDDIFK